MGRKNSNAPASDQVPTRKVRRKLSHQVSSPPSRSLQQYVQQPVQQTTRGGFTPVNILAKDSTSTSKLSQSSIQLASPLYFAAYQHNTKPPQPLLPPLPPLKEKKPRDVAPASTIYISPEYGEVESITDQHGNVKLRLPRLVPTYRSNISASSSSSYSSYSAVPLAPTPQAFPPFLPSRCHWRALRDVVFVKEGGIRLSPDQLVALLRSRYGKSDPQMARVEQWHLEAMLRFCMKSKKEMFEKGAQVVIREQMKMDLKLMMEGRECTVNEDF